MTFRVVDPALFLSSLETDFSKSKDVVGYMMTLITTAKIEKTSDFGARVIFTSPLTAKKTYLTGYYNSIFARKGIGDEFYCVDVHLLIRDMFVWLISLTQTGADAFENKDQFKSAMSTLADGFIQHFQGLNSGYARNGSELWISPRWTSYPPLGFPPDFDGNAAVFSNVYSLVHNPDELPDGVLRENRVKANRIAFDSIGDYYRVNSKSVLHIPVFSTSPQSCMDWISSWKPSLVKHPNASFENASTLDVKKATFDSPLVFADNLSEGGWKNPAFDDILSSGKLTQIIQVPFILDELDITYRIREIDGVFYFCTYGKEHYELQGVTAAQISFLKDHQHTLKVVFLAQSCKINIIENSFVPVRNMSRIAYAFVDVAKLPVFAAVPTGFYNSLGKIAKLAKYL